MEQSTELISAVPSRESPAAWSFLPYEEERDYHRRVLILKYIHAMVIPAVDVGTILLAMFAAYFISGSGITERLFSDINSVNSELLWLSVLTLPLWLMLFMFMGVYRREIRRLSVSTFDEFSQTIGALTIGAWLSFSFIHLVASESVSFNATWSYIAVVWVLLIVMVPFFRAITRIALSFHNPFSSNTLVVGGGEVGRSLIGKLGRHKEYGLRVAGFLEPTGSAESSEAGDVQTLGHPSDLAGIIRRYGISRVLIAFSRSHHTKILEIIHECQEMKVEVSIVPRFFEVTSSQVEIDDVEGLTIVSMPRYVRHGFFARAAKRTMDLFFSTMVIAVSSPLLILVSLLIKLDSPGPIFHRQKRMGKDHKPFMIYKFRSMKLGAESEKEELNGKNELVGPLFKMKNDPRTTRVGRVIRRVSIDELPQLINVIRGEMSLVGPRPLVIEEAEACTGSADMRHSIKPGITGLWQVLGRSDIPFNEMTQLDYLYVTNWTLRWDLKILLRTPIAIARKRGAY